MKRRFYREQEERIITSDEIARQIHDEFNEVIGSQMNYVEPSKRMISDDKYAGFRVQRLLDKRVIDKKSIPEITEDYQDNLREFKEGRKLAKAA